MQMKEGGIMYERTGKSLDWVGSKLSVWDVKISKASKWKEEIYNQVFFSFLVWFFFIVHDLEWLFEISLINYYGTSGPFNWARKSGKGKNKNVKGRDAQLKQEREKERKKEIEIERKRRREREREGRGGVVGESSLVIYRSRLFTFTCWVLPLQGPFVLCGSIQTSHSFNYYLNTFQTRFFFFLFISRSMSMKHDGDDTRLMPSLFYLLFA